MSSFKHVSNTWFVAQLFHPLVFYIAIGINENEWMPNPVFTVAIFVGGFLFTICSYLLCFLFFELVRSVPFAVPWKLCLWIISVCVCIPMGVMFTCSIFFGFTRVSEIWPLVIPGMIAAVLSILFRYDQFASIMNHQDLITQ